MRDFLHAPFFVVPKGELMTRTEDVVVVRIYMTEQDAKRAQLERRLREWGKVQGLTTMQGMRGFGAAHHHSDGPVIIEFYEAPERAEQVLEYLDTIAPHGHVVHWAAKLRLAEND
jgi:PII-like signaling protein